MQLQVIKALLTAVTCSTCDVHGTSLLLAVRACYHIHLVSKNAVNKATAKATLTQMLNIVFQRMEQSNDKVVPVATIARDGGDRGGHRVCADGGGHTPPRMFASTMYAAVDRALGFSPQRAPFDGDGQPAARRVGNKKRVQGAATHAPNVSDAHAAIQAPFATVLHKDAFLLFRALCKLSMKAQQGRPDRSARGESRDAQNGPADGAGGDEPDPIALKSKLLALELLLSVLEHSGPCFRSGPKFIVAIKHYLCSSLIKNCVSPVTQVVGLSLRIFAALQVCNTLLNLSSRSPWACANPCSRCNNARPTLRII